MSILLCVSGDLEVQIVEGLAGLDSPVPVLRRCADMIELVACAQAGIAEIAVVDDIDVTAAAELHACGLRIVGVMQYMDPGAGRHIGCDAIASPFADDVVACILNLQQMQSLRPDSGGSEETAGATPGEWQEPVPLDAVGGHPRGDGGGDAAVIPRGKIIAVWGSIGSPGRSTVARELACALGVQASTLLIDADVHGPAMAQLMGLGQETSAIVAVARAINMGEEDTAVVKRASIPLAGIDFLPGLNTGTRWKEIPRPVAEKLWGIARLGWDCIVVDCAAETEVQEYGFEMERDGVTLSLLEAADEVIVVGQAGPLGLRRLIAQLDHADDLGIESPHVVVTRVGRGQMNSSTEIAALLVESGRESAFCIREDSEHFTRAENRGVALREIHPGCAGVKDIAALAARLVGESAGSRVPEEHGRPRFPPERLLRARMRGGRGWLTEKLARRRAEPGREKPSRIKVARAKEDAVMNEAATRVDKGELGSQKSVEKTNGEPPRRVENSGLGDESGGIPNESGGRPDEGPTSTARRSGAPGVGDAGADTETTSRNGRHRRAH